MREHVVRYALPLVPSGALAWVVGLGDRYFLAGLSGKGAAGVYGAAYGLVGQPFILVAGILAQTLRPLLFDAVTAGDRAKARKIVLAWLAVMGALGAAGVAGVAVLGRFLVSLALGPSFQGAASFVTWIAAAHALLGIEYAFDAMMYARRRTGRVMAVQVVGAVVALGLYAILIPRWGATGAAVATFAAMAAMCASGAALAGLPWLLGRHEP